MNPASPLAKLNYQGLLGQLGCLMAKLSDLGFLKGAIAETIVSTYNADGSPNAAPMGVSMIDDDHVAVEFFNSSTTFSNVKANRCAVVNLTSNIEVYYRTAFKEANPDGVLPQEWFQKAAVVNAPKLALADATFEISIYNLALNSEKSRALFKVRSLEASQMYPQVYCRAFGATVEAIILATRVKVLADSEAERERVGELLRRIQLCSSIVDRVATGSAYSAVMADLEKRTAVWGQK